MDQASQTTSTKLSPSPTASSRVAVAQAGMSVQIPCIRYAADSEKAKQRVAELPRQGDGFDFERLYRTYSRRVFTLCLRMARDWAEAEDLSQEIFLQLFRKLHTFRGESAFRTWLFRLVTNMALKHIRKNKRLVMQGIPLEGGNALGEESVELVKVQGAPDIFLAGANDRAILERAIGGLPQGYRRIFLLHDLEGYEHSEIAAMLGLEIGTSKSQLYKARRHLRRLLRRADRRWARGT